MTSTSLGYCKLCELEDFRRPELKEMIRDIFEADRRHFDEREFPDGREYRKYWEVAMTARAFQDLGVLREDATLLGVGAGHEATVYWLTQKVGRVVATDLYETEDAWSASDSSADMLTDPGRFWEGTWNPDRLEVRHMNALQLDFPDDHFDAVFSSSSIEHFGSFAEIRRSIEEIYRVLKPGGVAGLATEFKLEGPGNGWPGVYLFDEAALRAAIFDGLWWDPATPLDTSASPETLRAPVELQEALGEQRTTVQVWSRYPHLVLRNDPFLFTSVHVAMVKSGSGSATWRQEAPNFPPREERGVKERLAALKERLAR
jgi:ubiquinone/menaquinone biosynthesis C-methylase UbiE